jgi:hypothetical protein
MAHDGSTWPAPHDGQAKLAAGAGGLVARCACGGSARIDPAGWLAEGLGDLPLRSFEARLRCGCGARRVRLTLACAASPIVAAAPSPIYRFR